MKEQGEEAIRLASEVSVRTKAEARELDQRNLLQPITECSLFRNSRKSKKRTEIIILITPRLINQ